MSTYTPPEQADTLAIIPALQAKYLQELMPSLYAGEIGVEGLQAQIRKVLAEQWPGQKKERKKHEQQISEQLRDLAEIRANQGRTEPVFVRLPKGNEGPAHYETDDTLPQDEQPDEQPQGEGKTKPAGDSDSGNIEQDMEPEIEVQGEGPAAKAQKPVAAAVEAESEEQPVAFESEEEEPFQDFD